MSAEAFITFAYGSNMPAARLQERCPSARAIGIAELSGHELRWHKRSRDGSGKCDIAASACTNVSVLGVLYEIAADEKRALDRAEGLGAGYEEIEVEVLCDGSLSTAKAYRATDTDPSLRPYTWYRALVIAGAREHGLPESYITRLESVPAEEDQDRVRHNERMTLIAEVQA